MFIVRISTTTTLHRQVFISLKLWDKTWSIPRLPTELRNPILWWNPTFQFHRQKMGPWLRNLKRFHLRGQNGLSPSACKLRWFHTNPKTFETPSEATNLSPSRRLQGNFCPNVFEDLISIWELSSIGEQINSTFVACQICLLLVSIFYLLPTAIPPLKTSFLFHPYLAFYHSAHFIWIFTRCISDFKQFMVALTSRESFHRISWGRV